MEMDIWLKIEELYQEFQKLGISQSVDYEKYYLYSLITHSKALRLLKWIRSFSLMKG
jgi:hypothetical protein